MRCRFCKILEHVIAECPTLPQNLKEGPKEARKKHPMSSWVEKREIRGKAVYTGANKSATAMSKPKEKKADTRSAGS